MRSAKREWEEGRNRMRNVRFGVPKETNEKCQVKGARREVAKAKCQVRGARREVPNEKCQVRSARRYLL